MCVGSWASVTLSLPRWANSGITSATRVINDKFPSSTWRMIGINENCLDTDIVKIGSSTRSACPAALSA